jgi:DNA-binding NarL/FixJ family response regulator
VKRSKGPIRVLIADDHPVFRRCLLRALEPTPDLAFVAQAATADEAVAQAARTKPDVVLFDLWMPSESGSVEDAIRQLSLSTNVLVFTGVDKADSAAEAIRAGAGGYLTKTVEANEVADAIRAVAKGELVIDELLEERVVELLRQPPMARLTPREEEIVRLLALRLSDDEVAAELGISPATVRTHVTSALSKRRARSRVELVLAIEGHVRPGPGDGFKRE